MGPQRKMGIYVGYDSPSIVRYLEPLTKDLFTARFTDCHFDKTVFSSIGGDKHTNVPVEHRELSWYATTMFHLDPCTTQSETEVTRSHIPTANTPTRIDVPRLRQQPAWESRTVPEGGEAAPSTRQGTLVASQSSTPTLKCGRPFGSKDS
ncbi:hypothetical protein EV2_036023 [Malus domestica]